MKVINRINTEGVAGEDLFLCQGRQSARPHKLINCDPSIFAGAVIGELLGITTGGSTALVAYPGQAGAAAISARSTVDLNKSHVGKQVVLIFEYSDPSRPIVIGALTAELPSLRQKPGSVDIEADGKRLIVTAREELVLRCGDATITLTKAGEISMRGTSVSTHASGVNRIKGGSVQIN